MGKDDDDDDDELEYSSSSSGGGGLPPYLYDRYLVPIDVRGTVSALGERRRARHTVIICRQSIVVAVSVRSSANDS